MSEAFQLRPRGFTKQSAVSLKVQLILAHCQNGHATNGSKKDRSRRQFGCDQKQRSEAFFTSAIGWKDSVIAKHTSKQEWRQSMDRKEVHNRDEGRSLKVLLTELANHPPGQQASIGLGKAIHRLSAWWPVNPMVVFFTYTAPSPQSK